MTRKRQITARLGTVLSDPAALDAILRVLDDIEKQQYPCSS